jgi:hypothetical protein
MHHLCVAKDFLDLEGFESCKESINKNMVLIHLLDD